MPLTLPTVGMEPWVRGSGDQQFGGGPTHTHTHAHTSRHTHTHTQTHTGKRTRTRTHTHTHAHTASLTFKSLCVISNGAQHVNMTLFPGHAYRAAKDR